MKIEYQNSVVRLSFLCRITDIKIAWIYPCVCPSIHQPFRQSILRSVCVDVFVELDHEFFLNFGIVFETIMKFGVTEPDFF